MYREAEIWRIVIQPGLGKKGRPYVKNDQRKKARGGAQAVECPEFKPE
jgi:hypothetical protein